MRMKKRSMLSIVFRRLLKRRTAMFGLLIFASMIALALFADLIAP